MHMKSVFSLFVLIFVSTSSSAELKTQLFPIGVGNNWGYIDTEGRMVVEPQFDAAETFLESGRAAVKLNGKWGLIDNDGRMTVEPAFDELLHWSGRYPLPAKLNGKWGYIDAQGHMVIELKFDHARIFCSNGLAPVQLKDKWGFIDTQGKFAVEPTFEELRPSFTLCSRSNPTHAKLNGKWGYIDDKGQIIIEPKYADVSVFGANHLAPVKVGDKWGFINEQGRMVIKPQFDLAFPFKANSPARIRQNSKWGFIDAQGRMIAEPVFDTADDFSANGLAHVELDGKHGFINAQGLMVIEAKFDRARWFSPNGLAPVAINNKWGYIDSLGRMVIEPIFNDAWPFNDNGLGYVRLSYNSGYIDTQGQLVAMPVEGCDTAIVLGKNNVVTWTPWKGQSKPEVVDCILWSRAIEDLDPKTMKSLLAHGARPASDNAALSKVVSIRLQNDLSETQRVDFVQRQIEVVKLLVSQGADPGLKIGPSGVPLLASALKNRQMELALALIELGASVSDCAEQKPDGSCNGDTLPIMAIHFRNLAVLQAMFAKHVDLNVVRKDGSTILGYVLTHQPSRLKGVCRHSAGSIDCKAIEPETFDMHTWVKQLLDHGANPNQRSKGFPPLALTTLGDAETIQMLVSHGGKMSSPSGKFNVLGEMREIGPVTWAIQNGRDDLLQIALAQNSRKLDTNDNDAIAFAVEGNQPNLVHELLLRGADANLTVGPLRSTLLDVATGRGYTEVARKLIRGGAKVDQTSPAMDYWMRLSMLNGVDANLTPLMVATIKGNVEMVKLLLENGADVTKTTGRGDTARTFATHPEIIRLFKEHGAKLN